MIIMIPTPIAGDVVERAGLTAKTWLRAIHFGTTAAKSINAIAAGAQAMRMIVHIGRVGMLFPTSTAQVSDNGLPPSIDGKTGADG